MPLFWKFIVNREGTDLCKVFPHDVQCADTADRSVVFAYNKIPHGFIEFVERPGDHLLSFCKVIHEFVHLLQVGYLSFSYFQCISSLR